MEMLDVPVEMIDYKSNTKPKPFNFSINFMDPHSTLALIIAGKSNFEQDPLWTAIIDCGEIFSWPDGKMLIDFPKFTDLTLVQNRSVFSEKIKLNSKRHLLIEEFSAFFNQKKKTNVTDPSIFDQKLDVTNYSDNFTNMLDHPTYYQTTPLDFEDADFVPINRMPNSTNPIKDILNGALLADPKKNSLDDGFEYEDNKELTCYLTGLPLFGKAYVFDIYRQDVMKRIKKEELKNYPSAKEVNGLYVPHIESHLEMEIFIDNRATVTPLFQFRTFADLETEQKFLDAELKKHTKKKKRRGDEDQTEDEPLAETKTQARTTKQTTKSKFKRSDGLIDIEYEVNFPTPRPILVSPYYVHSRGGDNHPLNLFAQSTRCHYIVWETQVPRTFDDILATLPISEEKKQLFKELLKIETKDGEHIRNNTETENFVVFTSHDTFHNALLEKITKPASYPKKIVQVEYVV